jgi:hypothetical protein
VNTSGLGEVTALTQTYRAALKEYGRTPIEFPITVGHNLNGYNKATVRARVALSLNINHIKIALAGGDTNDPPATKLDTNPMERKRDPTPCRR